MQKQTYLNMEGRGRPLISPVPSATLDRARAYRIARVRRYMAMYDCAALLLYDPVNIRYALDSSNMGVWTSRYPTRYALIVADGPAIMFEFSGSEHVNHGLPAIDEIRTAISWSYAIAGDHADKRVANWAGEIADILAAAGRNRRLAVDKLDPPAVFALQQRGIEIVDALPITEHARAIKSADEIELMRWSLHVCEVALARMYDISEPGRTEREIWAELHYENARSGGEWLETKLLTAGPRTNPWYQECSDYVVQRGDMIAVDTDMIGPYGYCADLSRSWTCGHVPMTNLQRDLYGAALDQINHNLALLRPGLSFREFNEKSWRIPEKYQPYRYTLAIHGTGLADEWPVVYLHPDFAANYDGHFEENMVVNVESLIAEKGSESVKLETQVLITATGAERLDSFPWETR